MKISFITGPGQGTEFVRTLKALQPNLFKPPRNKRGVEELDGRAVTGAVGELLKDQDQLVVLDEDTPNAVKALGLAGQMQGKDRLILIRRWSGDFNHVNPDTSLGGVVAFQHGVWVLQRAGLLPMPDEGSFVYSLHPGHGKKNDEAAAKYIGDGLHLLQNIVIVDGQGNQEALDHLKDGHPRLFIVFNTHPFTHPKVTQDLDEAKKLYDPDALPMTERRKRAILKEWAKVESAA